MDKKVLIEKSLVNQGIAVDLREAKKYDAAANRLYYALFQSVKAFALKIKAVDVDDKRDQHRIMEQIVRENSLGTTVSSRLYSDLRALRVKGDYTSEQVDEYDLDSVCMNSADSLRKEFVQLAS